MTNTVTTATAHRLASAGFPQPQPAPGQWWGDETKLVLIWRKWEGNSTYYTVIINDAIEPAVEYYFDAEDFTGLVYLPTATDILRECSALIKLSYHFKLFYATYSGSDDSDTGAFLLSDTNPAEAAAIAYLSIHEKK